MVDYGALPECGTAGHSLTVEALYCQHDGTVQGCTQLHAWLQKLLIAVC